MRIALATIFLAAAASAAHAQGADPLPAKLSGRWTFINPNRVFTDFFTITFEVAGAPGTVAGRLTWRGVSCGAENEPIKASWDGATSSSR